MDLSKKDKKVARELIARGLQKELAKGLLDFDSILHDWKAGKTENRASYHSLYKKMIDFDKHIGKRYDGITGSRYLLVVIALLTDGIISEEDLSGFSIDSRKKIEMYLSMAKILQS